MANNLIVVSDLHCGCRLGLCTKDPVPLDDGGEYHPSALQQTVWGWWHEFWDEWVPRACRDEPFDIVVNGDALDGVHHGAVTQISHNLEDQAKLALAILKPVRDRCEKFYMIRGTEAHVGKSGQEEERLARELEAIPDEAGRHARYELWKRVGTALCHIMHHISPSGRAAYETSAVQAELIAEFAEAGQSREEPPDFVVRSHRHRYIKVDNPTSRGGAFGIVTPGWQLKTPFVFKIAGGRISQPQFGGILIRQGDEEFYPRACYWRLGRPKVED